MGNREPVEDLPGSVRNPVPEMRDRHSPAADMVNRMKADPEIMAEVLQHLQVTRRTAVIVADPPPGNRLQMIFSAFWAIASGGCLWAWFGLVVVFTTLKQIAKTEGEIPKEQRGKVEKWNRNLEEVEKNMNRVEQDVGNMKEAIERAAEDNFRISYINNKKLEMALVKAQSHFRSCQDDATDVREASSGLQRAAKDSARSARLVTGATFAAAAALIALCCYNWTGSIMPNQSDDDVNTKMTTTSAMITGFLLMGMVTFSRLNAQNLFNNKKLLAECEKFQDEKLHLVDRALKVLKRDIELVADLKEKLDVMDITASQSITKRAGKLGVRRTRKSKMASNLPVEHKSKSYLSLQLKEGISEWILMSPSSKAAIYWLIVVAGSLSHDFLPLPDSYFSNEKNVFIVYFVKVGWGWTLDLIIPFISLTLFAYTSCNPSAMLRHLSRLVVGTCGWYFWVSLFVYIEELTGFCEGEESVTSKRSCHLQGYDWDGFDISGHTFLLTYSALIISEEIQLKQWLPVLESEKSKGLSRRTNMLLIPLIDLFFTCASLLLVLWEFMLFCISVYFHTVQQKVLGALIALFTWHVTYKVWYKSELSPGVPWLPHKRI